MPNFLLATHMSQKVLFGISVWYTHGSVISWRLLKLGFAKGAIKKAKYRFIQATSESLNTVKSTMRPNMRDTKSCVSLVIKFVVRYKAIELHTKQYFCHHQQLLHQNSLQ